MPIRETCAGTMEGPTCPWRTPKPPPFSCAGAHNFSASEAGPRWTASPHTKRRKSIIRAIPAPPYHPRTGTRYGRRSPSGASRGPHIFFWLGISQPFLLSVRWYPQGDRRADDADRRWGLKHGKLQPTFSWPSPPTRWTSWTPIPTPPIDTSPIRRR